MKDPLDACECNSVHPEGVNRARGRELPVVRLLAMADHFKLFADPTRLRILTALSGDELCVCDLSLALGMKQSAVSHQLALLRHSRLVRARRDGKTVYYALDDAHVETTIALASAHVIEKEGSPHA